MLRTPVLTLASTVVLLAAACGAAPAASTPAAPASKPAVAASAAASATSPKPAASAAASGAPAASAKPAGSAAASAAAKPGALTTVKYGLPTQPPAITTVGVYFGIENGYFKDEGLDVQVTPYNGAVTAVRALLSRDADVVLTGGDTSFLAQANGAPIKIISSPVVQGAITGGSGVISGHFTEQRAKDLATQLNAGALPVELTRQSVQTVSPTPPL